MCIFKRFLSFFLLMTLNFSEVMKTWYFSKIIIFFLYFFFFLSEYIFFIKREKKMKEKNLLHFFSFLPDEEVVGLEEKVLRCVVSSSWCGLLTSLSTLLDACTDEAATETILQVWTATNTKVRVATFLKSSWNVLWKKICSWFFSIIRCSWNVLEKNNSW